MVGRRSVWSDDRVIELAKEFVPCTDEVYRLEMNKDPDCQFFQNLAEQGHYAGPRHQSKQGIYICSADGTFLGSINHNDPEEVLKLMKRGLKKFAALSKTKKKTFDAAKIKSSFRWESSFPSDGLVLAVYSRDLPKEFSADANKDTKWNRDTAWFTKEEMLEAIPKEAKAGTEFSLPDVYVGRLAKMHFVDSVRGQTDSFAGSETEASKLTCKITKLTNDRIEFDMSGSTHASSTSNKYRRTPRGIVTKVKGSAVFLRGEERFEEFDLVAIGYRWGRTRFNGRHGGPNSNPIGFAVSLAPKDEAPNVPGLIYAYDVDWLKRD